MTCIVGLLDEGKIWMGADSAAVSGMDLRIREDPKIFTHSIQLDELSDRTNFLIGGAGSVRMNQILNYHFYFPKNTLIYESPYEYMVKCFIPELRDVFKKCGYSQIHDNTETYDGLFMVGFSDSLFTVYSDFQVEQVKERYTAIGCGKAYALGCLYGIRNYAEIQDFDAKNQIEIALEAAGEFSAGVRRPFHILSI